MPVGLSTDLRNDRLDLIATAIDAGAGAGTLKLYTATQPATGAAITTQTLLATLTFADPCVAAPAAAGVLEFDAIVGDDAVADGTATWARAADSDATFVADFDVTVTGGSGAIKLNTVTLITGGPVTVTSAILTEGNP